MSLAVFLVGPNSFASASEEEEQACNKAIEIVKKDTKKGVFLLVRLANQGYAEAQCELGIVYEKGLGGVKNESEVF